MQEDYNPRPLNNNSTLQPLILCKTMLTSIIIQSTQLWHENSIRLRVLRRTFLLWPTPRLLL
jgi:hypothetical protein